MNGLHYTLAGEQRKQMAHVISEIIQEKVVYKRVPTCAYQIGSFTISKDGVLSWAEDTDTETVKGVVAGLQMMGFTAKTELRIAEQTDSVEKAAPDEVPEEGSADFNKLTVEIPLKLVNEATFANLDRIIEGKGNLIRKAIGADSLAYEVTDRKVLFPWFTLSGDADEALAYTQLISKLVEQARTAKRVTMKEKKVENEKYAFRCFLLRLGFIGDEYKAARRVLLKNLTGNGARKNGEEDA
ncbi:virulence protein [bacterium]|nr:virulence protein [bacterium]MDY3020996.1 virulence protein [Oliverpabstia sp.]